MHNQFVTNFLINFYTSYKWTITFIMSCQFYNIKIQFHFIKYLILIKSPIVTGAKEVILSEKIFNQNLLFPKMSNLVKK